MYAHAYMFMEGEMEQFFRFVSRLIPEPGSTPCAKEYISAYAEL